MDKAKYQKMGEDATEYLKYRLCLPNTLEEEPDFSAIIAAAAYSRMCIGLLKKNKLNPTIAAEIAKFYLSFKDNYTASVITVNRYTKLRRIHDFARGYPARLPEFVPEITAQCMFTKAKKCIVMYNYNHKISTIKELSDLDELYHGLKANGITLLDAIRVTKGKPKLLISPILSPDNNSYIGK